MKQVTFFAAFILLFSLSSTAQQKKITKQEYIATYKDFAIQDMIESGVPASITLAQAILESSSGNSKLATKAKNHFGIKCHSSWSGPSIKMDDDEKNECFRKYKTVLDS
ncbi:MAG: glucosaminidase domain-containing protein, partial [Bacteroidia bacterium]|nr:glucosaminidase domain-containing protein [Bacteroidia bacterium]